VISKDTIDKIFDAVRIEEVIGEFVTLKKSGSSFKGLSPFVDERTPSFMVSPSKQIFKDFSSGKGGSAVTFLMEHEQMSYPEALRYLAEKYNIEIEETAVTPEQEAERSRRESLFIASEWAQKWFENNLHQSPEGQAIGQSHFKERGFTQETIETFKLGYAIDRFDAMTNDAKKEGYSQEYLVELGLLKNKNGKVYDGFKGRVMFPIHNLSGRALGFGGRTLLTDKKVPKYINSPECEIYHKSKIVYGIYQAKKYIVKHDNCFLVEGYTDVISMHQAGIKNVVASSGTALTPDQVKLIGRYSQNITILYDADPAGIKASFRGIDIILEQGLNVKAALLPEGEDPDSFSKARDVDEITEYFDENVKDFVVFKTQLLAQESAGDPIKKAEMVRSIMDSVAIIPDAIKRAVYTKECSTLLDIEEKTLVSELNKTRLKKQKEDFRKNGGPRGRSAAAPSPSPAPMSVGPDGFVPPPDDPSLMDPSLLDPSLMDPSLLDPSLADPSAKPFTPPKPRSGTYHQEKDIFRLMLNYGTVDMEVDAEDEEGNDVMISMPLAEFVYEEIVEDELEFDDPDLQLGFNLYMNALRENDNVDPFKQFANHENTKLREMSVDMVTEKYVLHKWDSQNIEVVSEKDRIFRAVRDALYAFKARRINDILEAKRLALKDGKMTDDQIMELLKDIQVLDETRKQLLLSQGITIFK
jgi:DNA primase